MQANPTAGILLLLGAAALITLGMTDKGKQVIAILAGTASVTAPTTTGGNAGEKAAVSVKSV